MVFRANLSIKDTLGVQSILLGNSLPAQNNPSEVLPTLFCRCAVKLMMYKKVLSRPLEQKGF
jgi:hypothetical protein